MYVGLFFVFCLTPQTPVVIGDKNTLSVNIYKTHGTILQFGLRKNLNLQQCSFYSTQALRYLTSIAFHCPCATKHTQHKLFRCTMSRSYEIADRVFFTRYILYHMHGISPCHSLNTSSGGINCRMRFSLLFVSFLCFVVPLGSNSPWRPKLCQL